jgi:TPR repeat protein
MKRWVSRTLLVLSCSYIASTLAADPAAEEVFRRGDDLYQRQQFAAAAPLLQQAASMGHAEAQMLLASMYGTGRGVGRDPRRAAQLYEAAGLQGNVPAQLALGVQYEIGNGVPRDREKALYWLRQAAGNGDARAAGYVSALEQPDAPIFRTEQALADYVQRTARR